MLCSCTAMRVGGEDARNRPSLLSSIPCTHVRGWSRRQRSSPDITRVLETSPQLPQTLLIHQLLPHAGSLQDLTNILPKAEAEVAVGWQLPILYRQLISPTYSQLQEDNELKNQS